jgi:hypothetical protein
MTGDWHHANRGRHGDSYRPGYTKLPSNTPVSPRQIQSGLRKLKPEGICADCPKPVERRSSKGPCPRRCPGCTAARKALRDRLRKRGKLAGGRRRRKPVLPRDQRPPCCRESGKITCDQHQQARESEYESAKRASERNMVDRMFAVFGDGFSVQ